MNWKFFICCLSFAIEAYCLRGTGHMWQPRPPVGDITSCNAPSLRASDAGGAASKTATTAIKIAAPVAGKVITDPAAMTLTNYVYQCASRQASLASTCSQQTSKLEPESKPESLYPEWDWEQEQQGLCEPEPEVPKPRTVTLGASELEVARLRWAGHLHEDRLGRACGGETL